MEFEGLSKVHEGKFITRYDLKYRTGLGNIKNYEMVSRNKDMKTFEDLSSRKAEAVVLIVHDKAKSKILLNKEYRMAVGGFAYNFPAGLIDPGEDEATAAKRELWEETGLSRVEVLEVWPESFSGVGITNEMSKVLICVAEGEFAPSTSDEEEIEATWYTKEEVRELLKLNNFAARTQAYCWLWAGK